jgi:radical SAM protein
MAQHPLSFASFDFDETPFLVIWETTQACPLACRHCRAEAEELRDPNELTTDEGRNLLDQIKGMGTPVCVLSGGDPLKRPDLSELVAHGSKIGLRMATIPAASADLTRNKLLALKEAGLAQVAFSLDGSSKAKHDDFRKVEGTFDKTMEAVRWAHELEMPLQINTTFTHDNFSDADEIIALVRTLGIVFWEVFSLVPTGRGVDLTPLSAEEHEALFAKLYALSKEEDFLIKVTEAPHYRRFIMQQREAEGGANGGHPHSRSAVPAQLSREMTTHASFGMKAKGINSGKGFVFVSHVGEVFPSGFLPFCAGNVRETPLVDLYRDNEVFRMLRDPSRLTGRCGVCEFADVCGGSRSRAYAVTGDMMAEDPACSYEP